MVEIRGERTDEEIQDLRERLDVLINKSDTSFVEELEDYQRRHTLHIGDCYHSFMNEFEMYFNAMSAYSTDLYYLKKNAWSSQKTMKFIIATLSLKQFYSAYLLLHRGMYEDAITLMRSVYEAYLRIVFISIHPECPENAYKTSHQKGANFNATGLIKNELELDWDTYRVMSIFAHSNQYDAMDIMLRFSAKEQTDPFCLRYEVDEMRISLCIGIMRFMLTAFLGLYAYYFEADIPDCISKQEYQKAIDLLRAYADISLEELSGQKNEYWRIVAVDISSILELMHRMDTHGSGDWKVEWLSIRA